MLNTLGLAGRYARLLCLISLLATLTFSGSACNRAEPEQALKNTDNANEPNPGVAPPTPPKDAPVVPPVTQFASMPGGTNNAAANNSLDGNNIAQTLVPPELDKPQLPGVQIETVPTIPSEGVDAAASPEATDAFSKRMADRAFMKLSLPTVPLSAVQLIAFLGESDRAVQELTIARQASQLTEEEFLQQAKRLSAMKLKASERLSAAPDATVAQKKTAIAGTVESLSQLTGLGDVDAAQKLQRVAGELATSPDLELAHQGKLVLFGFRLNQLLEGQIKDPQVLVADIDEVLSRPADRGLVEMLALQQCMGIMNQLGYTDQAKQVEQRIVNEYRNSENRDLAMRAWGLEVNNSPELNALHAAYQETFAGTEPDAARLATAASNLVKAFPSLPTLSYFLRMVIDLEYTGKVDAARQLAAVLASSKAQLPSGPMSSDIETVLGGHAQRLGLLGKPLQLEELVSFEGAPLDWSSYRGKVVLVYAWSSLEVPSLNLIEEVKKLRTQITDTNFEIVGINVDDQQFSSNAEQLVKRQSLSWRNVRSSNPAAQGLQGLAARTLGVNAYPHFTLLVDQAGTVRAVHLNFEKLPAMITELSAAKNP